MGINIKIDELYSAPQTAKSYIQKHKLRPYCLLHDSLLEDFTHIPQDSPNAVLLGDAQQQLNYTNLNKAFQLCQQGFPLIGIGKNKYFKSEDNLCLDAGPFVHGREWACNTRAIIMGKPDKAFLLR